MARDLRRDRDEAVRITTASSNREDEIWARQRRYIFSMALRTACFLLAIVFRNSWLCWVFIAGAVLLPYVAVVMANAVASRDDGFSLQDAGGRQALEGGQKPEVGPGRETL